MTAHTHLHRKAGIFYARFRVPLLLRPWLRQHELQWSLRTGSLKCARSRLLIASLLAQDLFTLVTMNIPQHPILTDSEKLALHDVLQRIKQAKLEEFRQLLEGGEHQLSVALTMLRGERPQIEHFEYALSTGRFDSSLVIDPASELLANVGGANDGNLAPDDLAFAAEQLCVMKVDEHRQKAALLNAVAGRSQAGPGTRLDDQSSLPKESGAIDGVMAAARAQHPRSISAARANSHLPFHPDVMARMRDALLQPRTPAQQSRRLSEAVSLYLEESRGSGNSEKTTKEYAGVLRKFVEFSDDPFMHELSRDHARGFRDALRKYPTRLAPKDRTLGFKALVQRRHPETLSAASINKHLDTLSYFLKWAKLNKLIPDSEIADSLKIKAASRASEAKDRFEPADLALIFGMPEFLGQKAFTKTAFYWAPLICLYSGMRSDEAAQLRVVDIRQDRSSGHHYFDINDEDDDRKLKNLVSKRVVPVHSKLIELGLIEYVEMLRERGHRMLFPSLPRSRDNGYAHAIGKWFSERKKGLGFDRKKTFHSFRHTVSDELRQNVTPDNIHSALLGHSTGKETFDRYSKDLKVETSRPFIENLRFEIPAKPFSECQFTDTEKKILRSPRTAKTLTEKRKADRVPKSSRSQEKAR